MEPIVLALRDESLSVGLIVVVVVAIHKYRLLATTVPNETIPKSTCPLVGYIRRVFFQAQIQKNKATANVTLESVFNCSKITAAEITDAVRVPVDDGNDVAGKEIWVGVRVDQSRATSGGWRGGIEPVSHNRNGSRSIGQNTNQIQLKRTQPILATYAFFVFCSSPNRKI
jgi:hypothetical protein